MLFVCFVAAEKPLETTNVTKMKTGSSSSDSSDSSDSEDSENGNVNAQQLSACLILRNIAVVLYNINFPRISTIYFINRLSIRAGSQAAEEDLV